MIRVYFFFNFDMNVLNNLVNLFFGNFLIIDNLIIFCFDFKLNMLAKMVLFDSSFFILNFVELYLNFNFENFVLLSGFITSLIIFFGSKVFLNNFIFLLN